MKLLAAKCIDYYTQQRIALIEDPNAKPIDARLEAIVNRMFQRCLDDGQFRQALGLALETRRMDIFQASIVQSEDVAGMLSYAFQVRKKPNFFSWTFFSIILIFGVVAVVC